MLEKEGLASRICEKLKLRDIPNNLSWEELIKNIKNLKDENINIAIVGKYVKLEDSYLSIAESIKHGGFANGCKVHIDFIDCEKVTKENAKEMLGKIQWSNCTRWIWKQRNRRKNSNNTICKRKQYSIFRNMFRNTNGSCRICKRCVRI